MRAHQSLTPRGEMGRGQWQRGVRARWNPSVDRHGCQGRTIECGGAAAAAGPVMTEAQVAAATTTTMGSRGDDDEESSPKVFMMPAAGTFGHGRSAVVRKMPPVDKQHNRTSLSRHLANEAMATTTIVGTTVVVAATAEPDHHGDDVDFFWRGRRGFVHLQHSPWWWTTRGQR
jgi:hypothetical protein